MTLLEAVAERIGQKVDALAGRIEFVADLTALVSAGAMPQRDVTAFVLPLGFDDQGGRSASGLHTQILADQVGVLICVKYAGDAKARSALPKIDTLSAAVIRAVAGWAPADSVGVFAVKRGRLVSVANGLALFQLDFQITDQLRISPT